LRGLVHKMHQLSDSFERKLKNVDSNLRAIYDSVEDSIFVYALRQGLKVHELTSKRQYAENYEELENRTIQKLAACDVWKKFGDGKAYDDFLHEEEAKERAVKKKEVRDKRLAWFKENREMVKAAVWNAQHGRTDASTALPFQTAQFSMSDVKPESKNGFTVIDKRGIKSPEGQGVLK
jgi:hypothetical protein